MSCMPGYHIGPNGTLCWQKPNPVTTRSEENGTFAGGFGAEKGSRPTSVGHQFWV